MTTTEAILHYLKNLPESTKVEVLDFVEYLQSKGGKSGSREEDAFWSELSLTSAMRGMEDEQPIYSLADLKESFR